MGNTKKSSLSSRAVKALLPGSSDNRGRLRNSDSWAYFEGQNVAKEIFGNVGEALAKEKEKRK